MESRHLSSANTLVPDQAPSSSKNFCVSGEIEELGDEAIPLLSYASEGPSPSLPSSRILHKKASLHRSKTAPALAVITDLKSEVAESEPGPASSSIIKQAMFLLFFYLLIGTVFFSFCRQHFSGVETNLVVDALYFSIVTLCTIGYGDIAPLTSWTKLFACAFVLVGFGFLDTLLSGVVNYVLDLQEHVILNSIRAGGHEHNFAKNYIVDTEKGRMRIRMKVGLALAVVVMCVGTGTLVLHFMEDLSWVDSIYLAVMSVTTVGYGDQAFETLGGRLFASVWLLVSTLAVARAFLFLVEARIDKRHRRIANYVLQRNMTAEDWLAADINHTGSVSKSEYVLYKLKQMKKVQEKDILLICDQFNKLDSSNFGKIKFQFL